jgi:hypothetical protein
MEKVFSAEVDNETRAAKEWHIGLMDYPDPELLSKHQAEEFCAAVGQSIIDFHLRQSQPVGVHRGRLIDPETGKTVYWAARLEESVHVGIIRFFSNEVDQCVYYHGILGAPSNSDDTSRG